MRLFYSDNDKSLIKKIKYIIKHPWRIKYWLKEVKLGVRSAFRKRSVKMIISACMLILGILFVIAIFIHNLGQFVVTVDPILEDEGFVLSTSKDFLDTRYRLYSKAIEDCNNISINDLPLDLDEFDGSHNGENYIAYTFYIRNEGNEERGYAYALQIGHSTKNIEKATWVMVYRNGKPTIYAMEREDGTLERQYSYYEFPIVTANPNLSKALKVLSDDYRGLFDKNEQERLGVLSINGLTELRANAFLSDSLCFQGVADKLKPGEADKYTIVIWLEGEDPDCVDAIKGGEIEFNMNFFAVE